MSQTLASRNVAARTQQAPSMMQNQDGVASASGNDDADSRDGPGAPLSWNDSRSLDSSTYVVHNSQRNSTESTSAVSDAAQSVNMNAFSDNAVGTSSTTMLGNALESTSGGANVPLNSIEVRSAYSTNARTFANAPATMAHNSFHSAANAPAASHLFQPSPAPAQMFAFPHHQHHEQRLANRFAVRNESAQVHSRPLTASYRPAEQPVRRSIMNQDVRLEQKSTHAAVAPLHPLPPPAAVSAPPAVLSTHQPTLAEMYAARRTLGFDDRPLTSFTHWQQVAGGTWTLAPPPAVVDEPPRGHYWTVLEETAKQSQPLSSKSVATGTVDRISTSNSHIEIDGIETKNHSLLIVCENSGDYLGGSSGGENGSRNHSSGSSSQAASTTSIPLMLASSAASTAACWACAQCTFINTGAGGACSMCGDARTGTAGSRQSWLKKQNVSATASHMSTSSAAVTSGSSNSASSVLEIRNNSNSDALVSRVQTSESSLIETQIAPVENVASRPMSNIDTPTFITSATAPCQPTIEQSGGLAKLATAAMQLQFGVGLAPHSLPLARHIPVNRSDSIPLQQTLQSHLTRAPSIADTHLNRAAGGSDQRHKFDSALAGAWSVVPRQHPIGHYSLQNHLQHQHHHHQSQPLQHRASPPMHQPLIYSQTPATADLSAHAQSGAPPCNYCRIKSCLADPRTGLTSHFCSDQCTFAALR